MIATLWLLGQGAVGLFACLSLGDSLLERIGGPLAVSVILTASCLGVLWRDAWHGRQMDSPGLERAWRRARDRSVSRLTVFTLSLIGGGGLAVGLMRYLALHARHALLP